MSSYFRKFLLASALLVCGAQAALADNYEQYCDLQGFPAASRQTIIVLDERQVVAENGAENDERNGPWRRFIGRLVDFNAAAQLEQRFQPRERITILLARKDGSGAATVFTGCLPFFSRAEEARAAKNSGAWDYVNSYFGIGLGPTAKRDSGLFISRLGEAIREAVQPDALSRRGGGSSPTSSFATSGFVSSLKQSSFVNLNRGLPRILLVSNLTVYFADLPSDDVKARGTGLSAGLASGVNFKGAELYVVGVDGGSKSTLHDAAEKFFLASHASLISMGSLASMPDFLPAPAKIRRYQGTIQYPDRKYPIQLRLASDQNGTLVNSWITVQAAKESFVPLNGVITCNSEGCQYSDNNDFAQIWSATPRTKPTFDASLPFGGARRFEFSTHDDNIRGDIYDPNINYKIDQEKNAKSNRLHFFATYTAGLF